MQTRFLTLCVVFMLLAVACKPKTDTTKARPSDAVLTQQADSLLDFWHKAAAKADFEGYFDSMSSDAIFIGTDATEHWDVAEFKDFSKPYFDRGAAWDFKMVQRHIFVSEDGQTIWFDELLDTWMQICRGSGVIKKENGQWKIAHYVLSPTVSNDAIEAFITLKHDSDSLLVPLLRGQ